MATVKFLNAAGKYDDPGARRDVLNYIFRRDKTPSALIIGCPVDPSMAAEQMRSVAEFYHKDNKVRIRHFVISFYRNEQLTMVQLDGLAQDICREIGREYQIVCALHEDTASPHIHFVFNPVSYVDGHKYSGTREEHRTLKDLLRQCVGRFGIRVFYEVKYRPAGNEPHE